MPIGRRVAPVREVVQTAAALVPESKPKEHRLRNSVESRPLDWDVAVRAASVLLGKTFGPDGSADDPVVKDMARDLAARLCAYDEIEEAVERMEADLPAASDNS